MQAWESIQDTLDYIEEHYGEEIDIDKLATIAHLSKFYYQRLFYRLVKKNVSEYIKLRRLSFGAKMLKENKESILNIALECGFLNHSHFSKVFKETYGITPDEYRKKELKLDHFTKPNLLLNYIVVDIGIPLIVENMVLEINEHELTEDVMFIGNSQQALISEIGQSKTNKLIELWSQLPKVDYLYGADILTLTDNPDYFDYFVGIESKDNQNIYQKRIMPKGKYIVCSYEAENFEMLVNDALNKASQYLYEVWLTHHDMTPDTILVQKYFHPFKKNCYIELWAKIKES